MQLKQCSCTPSVWVRVPLVGFLASPLILFHSAISLAGSLDFRVNLKALKRQILDKTISLKFCVHVDVARSIYLAYPEP